MKCRQFQLGANNRIDKMLIRIPNGGTHCAVIRHSLTSFLPPFTTCTIYFLSPNLLQNVLLFSQRDQ